MLPMPEDIKAIFLNLIAAGLCTLGAKLGKVIAANSSDSDTNEFGEMLRETLSEVSEDLVLVEEKLEAKCLFLTSSDAESTVREILSTKLSASEPNSIPKIREAFVSSMAFAIDVAVEDIKNEAERVFALILVYCDTALKIAIENDCLAAHEGMSAFRHRQLADQLKAVDRRISSLATANN